MRTRAIHSHVACIGLESNVQPTELKAKAKWLTVIFGRSPQQVDFPQVEILFWCEYKQTSLQHVEPGIHPRTTTRQASSMEHCEVCVFVHMHVHWSTCGEFAEINKAALVEFLLAEPHRTVG